VNKFIILLEI